jgi:RNase H-fold protein (predicted Holliday junction resolvase)
MQIVTKSTEETVDIIIQTALQHKCDGIIVGLPVRQNGHLARSKTDNANGKICRQVARKLAAKVARLKLKVFLCDETRSTLEAKAEMRLKGMAEDEIKVSRWHFNFQCVTEH